VLADFVAGSHSFGPPVVRILPGGAIDEHRRPEPDEVAVAQAAVAEDLLAV